MKISVIHDNIMQYFTASLALKGLLLLLIGSSFWQLADANIYVGDQLSTMVAATTEMTAPVAVPAVKFYPRTHQHLRTSHQKHRAHTIRTVKKILSKKSSGVPQQMQTVQATTTIAQHHVQPEQTTPIIAQHQVQTAQVTTTIAQTQIKTAQVTTNTQQQVKSASTANSIPQQQHKLAQKPQMLHPSSMTVPVKGATTTLGVATNANSQQDNDRATDLLSSHADASDIDDALPVTHTVGIKHDATVVNSHDDLANASVDKSSTDNVAETDTNVVASSTNHYVLHEGSLRDNVASMVSTAGWGKLVWKVPHDYEWVGKETIETSSLESALQTLLADYPVQAICYQANHVVVVQAREETAS